MICIQKMTLHSIHNCTYVLNNEKSLQICQLYCVCLLQGGVHIKIKVLNLQLPATGLPSNYIAILQLKNCSLGEGSNLYNSLKQNILSYIAFQIPKAHHLRHLCNGITTKHAQKNIPFKLCLSQYCVPKTDTSVEKRTRLKEAPNYFQLLGGNVVGIFMTLKFPQFQEEVFELE